MRTIRASLRLVSVLCLLQLATVAQAQSHSRGRGPRSFPRQPVSMARPATQGVPAAATGQPASRATGMSLFPNDNLIQAYGGAGAARFGATPPPTSGYRPSTSASGGPRNHSYPATLPSFAGSSQDSWMSVRRRSSTRTTSQRIRRSRKRAVHKPDGQRPTSSHDQQARQSPTRLWTDNTGEFSTRALFLRFEDNLVWLRKADGGLARLPLNRLSPADQSYVLQHSKEPTQEVR